MSVRNDYERLLISADAMATSLIDMSQRMRQQAEISRQHLDDVAVLGGNIIGHKGSTIQVSQEKFSIALQREIARSRYRLANLHDYADHVHRYGTLLHTIAQDVRGPLFSALGMIPDPIWDFFDGLGVAIPTLSEVARSGGACIPRLQLHWDWNADAAKSFLEGLGGFFHLPGFSGGPHDPSVENAHASVGVALSPVDYHATAMANQVQQAHSQAQAAHQQGGCCSSEPATPYSITEPFATLHTKQDLQQRADAIHAYLTHGLTKPGQQYDYNVIAAQLAGLSPDDAQELEYEYNKKYGQDLYFTLLETFGDPGARYNIVQTFHPEAIRQQPDDMLPDDPTQHIVVQGPVATNTQATYSLSSYPKDVTPVDGFAIDAHGNVIRPSPDPKNTLGTRPVPFQINFSQPGVYTIVIELHGEDNSVQYLTYQQVVTDATQITDAGMQMVTDKGPISAQDYLENLKQAATDAKNNGDAKLAQQLNDAYTKAKGLLDSTCVPIPGYFTAKTGPSMSFPTSLFVKQLPNGNYQIIDLTNPDAPGVYSNGKGDAGDSLNTVWKDFMQNNPWPNGHLSVQAPKMPAGKQTMPWQTWEGDNDNPSFGKQAKEWLGGLSLILAIPLLIFPESLPLLALATTAGLAEAGFTIAGQAHIGQLDWEHGLEDAGIVAFNLVMFAPALNYDELAVLFGTDSANLEARMADIAAGRMDAATLNSLAQNAKLSPELLTAIAKDNRIFGALQGMDGDKAELQKLYDEYTALPASPTKGASFYDYYFTMNIPVADGSDLMICRYQQERLTQIQQQLRQKDPKTLTISEQRILAGDPTALYTLASKAGFDLTKLDTILQQLDEFTSVTKYQSPRTQYGNQLVTQMKQTKWNQYQTIKVNDNWAGDPSNPSVQGMVTNVRDPQTGKVINVEVDLKPGASDFTVLEEYKHLQRYLARRANGLGDEIVISQDAQLIEEYEVKSEMLDQILHGGDPDVAVSQKDLSDLISSQESYATDLAKRDNIWLAKTGKYQGKWVKLDSTGKVNQVWNEQTHQWTEVSPYDNVY